MFDSRTSSSSNACYTENETVWEDGSELKYPTKQLLVKFSSTPVVKYKYYQAIQLAAQLPFKGITNMKAGNWPC